MVNATGDLAQKRNGGCAHGCGTRDANPQGDARRLDPDEVRQGREVRAQDDRPGSERLSASRPTASS